MARRKATEPQILNPHPGQIAIKVAEERAKANAELSCETDDTNADAGQKEE